MKRFICGMIALAAIIFSGMWADQAGADALDDYASKLTGHTVTVECYPPDGVYAGYVYLTEPTRIHLDGALCGVLRVALAPTIRSYRFLASVPGGRLLGAAVATLQHEALHLRLNSADEGHVECVASRNTWPAILLLRLPRAFSIWTQTWAQYNHLLILDPRYRTEC